jgi:uncharacterized repeat protein (TIGR03837 family)
MTFPRTVHIFCRVIDNFGDIGVSWRLARQLADEYRFEVRLWVDNLASCHKICTQVDPLLDVQRVEGVEIVHWTGSMHAPHFHETADLVIEAFGCELPPHYIGAMARRTPKPVWINLEYLSAEPWVEGCHTMQSLYPSLPLVKYFFFPGFSNKTGGLLRERDLLARRTVFQNTPGTAGAFLESLGVTCDKGAFKISLFCYPDAPVAALFDALQEDASPCICLVPQGVAVDAVSAFLQKPATVGASATRGSLTVQILPFLDQPDYDKLLWACDLNFVRGEDSFVRAHWAGRPFVWNIYPQAEHAHQAKLNGFLERYTQSMPDNVAQTVVGAWRSWNGDTSINATWQAYRAAMPELVSHTGSWVEQICKNGDLACNLISFAKKIG